MDDQLLIRFFTHQCNPEELEQIDRFISEKKEHADYLFELEQLWNLKKEIEYSDKNKLDVAYVRFLSSLNDKERSLEARNKLQSRSRRLVVTSLGLVASLVIIFLLSVQIYQDERENNSFTNDNLVEAPVGQRLSLILSDGTKVWLNSGSRLSYPSRFATKGRTVELSGEGYFEVTRNEKAPFTVRTSDIDVKVLGTVFNVKSYPEEDISITLTEGKVELLSDHKSLYALKPKEQAVYSRENRLLNIRKGVNTEIVNGWKEGNFAFYMQPLEVITHALERRFGVTITITDPALAADMFTCHVAPQANLEEILELLKSTRKLTYKIEKNEITILKR